MNLRVYECRGKVFWEIRDKRGRLIVRCPRGYASWDKAEAAIAWLRDALPVFRPRGSTA